MSKQQEIISKASEILKKHSKEIQEKYSVNQIGIGYKVDKGKMTDKVAIICYVPKKKSKKELDLEGISQIPEEIDGIPTDIVEIPSGFMQR